MTIAYWQLYEALCRGAARFREERSPDATIDTPIEAAFRGLISARVTLASGLHVEKWVGETLIPELDPTTTSIGDREARALAGWRPTVIAYARELKRVAATLADPAELSSEGRRWLISAVIDGVLRDRAPWVDAVVEPLAVPAAAAESNAPARRLRIREGELEIGVLDVWHADDADGPGWRTRATTIDGEELLTGYLREPRRPGWRRRIALRPGEAELVADIAAHPDDDGPREVYADWLTERGDPRGELILLQIMRARGRGGLERADREASLLDLHGPTWAGLDPAWQLDWRAGFVEAARFGSDGDSHDEDVALWSFLERAEAGVLRQLAVTCRSYVAPLLAALPRARWPNLEELEIAWRARNAWDRFQLPAAEVQRLCANTPRLRRLELVGERLLPELAHPHLEELRLVGSPVIAGAGVDHARWRGEGIALPRLTRLALAFPDEVIASELVLDPAGVPALRHLALAGVRADAAATPLAWIARWPGAARLASIRVPRVDLADEPYLPEIAARLAGARIEVERIDGPDGLRARLHELLPQLVERSV